MTFGPIEERVVQIPPPGATRVQDELGVDPMAGRAYLHSAPTRCALCSCASGIAALDEVRRPTTTTPMSQLYIRPDLLYAWRGQSLF